MDDCDFDGLEALLKRQAAVWGVIGAVYIGVGCWAAWKCFQALRELKRLP